MSRREERPTAGARLEGKALEALEAPQDVPTRAFSVTLAKALFMQGRRGEPDDSQVKKVWEVKECKQVVTVRDWAGKGKKLGGRVQLS